MADGPVVYLLDDDPEMLNALTRLLRAQRLQVRGFTRAQEFFAHELQKGPACLVLEVAMPGIDGLQVLERLRQSGAELRSTAAC